MRLVATEFRAQYEVVKPFRLPFHSGSMLRGVLGRALRIAGCANRIATCTADCNAPSQCTYARLFDPPATDPPAHPFLRGQTRPPQPLIPLFPPPGQLEFNKGHVFPIAIRVLGPFQKGELEILLEALEKISLFEFGKERGIVAFQSAAIQGRREVPIGEDLNVRDIQRIRIEFETPAWLEHQGELMNPLGFRSFFRTVYRRLTVLCALYGELETRDDEDFTRLDNLADSISVAQHDIKALHWQRRSLAREREHPMHGLLGQVVFEGKNLAAFLPVLRMAGKTHIGKATSHGLGRILEYLE